MKKALLGILVLVTVIAAQGCGSSGETSTGSPVPRSRTAAPAASATEETMTKNQSSGQETGEQKQAGQEPEAGAGEGARKPASGSGAAAFTTKGGDNSIPESGTEASTGELEQAARTLHLYLHARAGEDWATACKSMAAGVTQSLQQMAAAAPSGAFGKKKKKKITCPTLIAAVSAGMPAYLRHELTQAQAGALRVSGESAFLLFHGAHHSDYFMPMAKEGGEWKVAALAASALP